MSTISERLTEFLKDSGVKKSELATALGVSPSAISKYFAKEGGNSMSATTLELLCRTYGLNKEWLLTGSGEMYAPKTKSQTIAEITAGLYKSDESSVTFKFITEMSKYALEMGEDQLTLVLKKFQDVLTDVLEEEKEKDSTEE